MARNIPFPANGNGQTDLSGTLKPIECECGSKRFRPSQDVIVVQDRLDLKKIGFAQIMEVVCVKCSTAYEMAQTGIKKVEPEKPAGGIVNG